MDMFGLPGPKANQQIYRGYGNNDGNIVGGFYVWTKPMGTTICQMVCIGSGSGGGGGFSAAAGNARGGGGGGASGSVQTLLIPIFALPDTLFVRVGAGGAGGSAGSNGTLGGWTDIKISNRNIANVTIISASNGGSGFAGAGSGTASGGAGQSGGAITPAATLGMFISYAGVTGGAGGVATGAVGAAIAILGSLIICSGAGGAGVGTNNTDFAGGDISAGGLLPSIAGGTTGGGAGVSGHNFMKPFVASGGSGGGSSGASGTGGAGGNGGVGSGGGGGGGGVTGGKGGRGGDGLIIITCW